MRPRNLDLFLITSAALLAVLVNWWWPTQVLLRAVIGIPLVLALPGYALTAALFPPGTMGWSDRLLCSCGLSLSLLVVLGLFANAVGIRLGTPFWSLSLFIAICIASSVAAVRQRALGESQLDRRLPRWRFYQAGLVGLALIVGTATLVAARQPTSTAGVSGYTLLWLLPSPSATGNEVQLGIESAEFQPTHYSLQLKADGKIVEAWNALSLAPGEHWMGLAAMPTGAKRVEADLYRSDSPQTIYRYVLLKP